MFEKCHCIPNHLMDSYERLLKAKKEYENKCVQIEIIRVFVKLLNIWWTQQQQQNRRSPWLNLIGFTNGTPRFCTIWKTNYFPDFNALLSYIKIALMFNFPFLLYKK